MTRCLWGCDCHLGDHVASEPPADRGNIVYQTETTNRLLGALTPDVFRRLVRKGSVVPLVRGVDLAMAGQPIEHCWFPLAGLVSVIAGDADGNEAEVGIIGDDGAVNASVLLGSERSEMRLLVQITGSAVRIEAADLVANAATGTLLTRLMLAYERSLSLQMAYTALAYARYPIDRRLARWILMSSDRTGGPHVLLTHDALSIMLGVRRAGVSEALHALVAKGAIESVRGRITVTDRARLVDLAGGSYGEPEAQYERLIGTALAAA